MNNVENMTEVVVQAGEMPLDGTLVVPNSAKGLVVFVHGSGSSRFSPRNQYIEMQIFFSDIAPGYK
jgi:putative phosphoribosyl transferase